MLLGSVTSLAVPGATAWDAIVGERFIALLGAPADRRVLDALAAAAGDPRPELERLVALIPAPLDDPGGSFALVWWGGEHLGEVTAVVRGDAVVDLESPGGSRRFDARGIRPWHLAEFGEVTGVRLTAADAPLARLGGGVLVPHARASLRASAIEWQRADATDGDRPAPDAERAATSHPAADADTLYARRPFDTDAVPTVSGPIAVGGAEAVDRAASVPSVRIAGGEAFVPSGQILIGRRPAAPRIASDGPAARLVRVDSPGRVVSSTHLELRVEGERLVASDLRSTNGTSVLGPNGSRRLRAGESIVVVPGMRLDLGDDTIIEILPPPGVDRTIRADGRPNT